MSGGVKQSLAVVGRQTHSDNFMRLRISEVFMHGPLHSHATELLCRLGQPKVNENTSIPESGNSISNCRSAMGFTCRIS